MKRLREKIKANLLLSSKGRIENPIGFPIYGLMLYLASQLIDGFEIQELCRTYIDLTTSFRCHVEGVGCPYGLEVLTLSKHNVLEVLMGSSQVIRQLIPVNQLKLAFSIAS